MTQNPAKLTPAHLSALLCARICHDLVGPVSAMQTGLDLLEDKDNADLYDDAIELIKLGAGQAGAKLEFLRLALGAGGSAPGIIPVAELERLARGVYDDDKIKMHWNTQTDGLSKPAARVLLGLIMSATQTIPRGGNINIQSREQDGEIVLSLVCEGPKARLEDNIARTLAGAAPSGAFDGRTVQPFYCGMIAREAGGRVETGCEGETVTFTAVLPSQTGADTASV
ncbi:MAG TPA: hypothetical protein ENK01_04175 [Hellea balneolensis]|uniref:Histidine phosphotransferase ChpT C-terminal domain-containing protein n=1 Tax=Hellea balneolensis TaxID=287478 RepID=A0A7V5U1F7_9PROT|nr:hypothetical protein [Hellea balneolensis]